MTPEAGQSAVEAWSVAARREAPYYLKGLAMGIPAILIGIQISAWMAFLSFPEPVWTRADFRDLYTSGYMVRSGYAHHLYDYDVQMRFQNELVSQRTSLLAFDHLAYETVLFVPFSYLPYPAAYFAFMAWNGALFILSFWILKPVLRGLSSLWKLLPIGIFLGFLPVTVTLMLGQDSVLILALFTLAAILLSKNRDLLAGTLLGLAFFKFQLVLPIAFLFLVWKRWRVFAGICLSAASVIIVSFLMVGASGMRDYISLLQSMSGTSNQYKYGLSTIAMPNLRGLISAVIGTHLPVLAVQVITVSISIVLMVWVAVAGRAAGQGQHALPIAITAATLVSYHVLIQDLSMLLIPIVLTLEQCVEAEFWDKARLRASCYAAALLLLAPSVAFFFTRYFCVTALPLGFLLTTLLRSSSDFRSADQLALSTFHASS